MSVVHGVTEQQVTRRYVATAIAGVAAVGIGVALHPGGWVHTGDPVARFLIAVTVVMVVCHSLGALAHRLGQPWVTGEVLGGIALGPSLFGLLWAGGRAWIFTPAVDTAISMAAQLGLATFMFLLGCELQAGGRTARPRAIGYVVMGAMGVPFVLGVALATLSGRVLAGSAGRTGYLLFVGLALSITAVPVLARILLDLRLQHNRVGALSLAAAAVGDGVAWVAMAVILIVTGSGGGAGGAIAEATAIVFVCVAVGAVRPLLARFLRERDSRSDRTAIPLLIAGATGFAALTQFIGLHLVIGAFLFGAILPRDLTLVARLCDQLRGFAVMVLLPLFFVSIGLSTSVGLLGSSAANWAVFGALLLTAVGAKFAGASIGGRLAGLRGLDLARLGALLNCRGVTELVVASIGYQAHLISPIGLTMFVLVALLTTLVTTPMMRGFGLRSAPTVAVPAVTTSVEVTGEAGATDATDPDAAIQSDESFVASVGR